MANTGQANNSFEQIITRNRYGVRTLQTNYLKNEYQKMTAAKNIQKQQQKQQKQQQHQMLNQLNSNYMNQINEQRRRRSRQMKSLSMEYQDFIRNKDQSGKYNKNAEKNLEKSTLYAPTWIRDVYAEKQTHKKNVEYYGKVLADHVKMQDIRKDAEKEEEMFRKKRIEHQAEEILKKERVELEARHRQKSMFQKRQNDLLGVKSHYNDGIGGTNILPHETILRKREQDLYSQGLQLQFKKEQQKRYTPSQDKMAAVNLNVYNPITNPMPFVYKNPNVLRMMANT